MARTEKLNSKVLLANTQKIVSDGKAVVDFPRSLEKIYSQELWREWTSGSGKHFDSFIEAVSAKQPYGLGLGQYNGWIAPMQAYELCKGFSGLRAELLKLCADAAKPIAAHGGARKQGSNATLNDRGAEYLLGRLKRDHPEVVERIAKGELTSIRDAAIKAGIIKPKDSDKNRCPVSRMKQYWRKASDAERQEFRNWLRTKEAKS